ncbi:MAG: NUDIX domain-containing protein [Gemmatimonadota bacterium]|nr:NUDIX domain-containing protein [Gemmatimonadota bacterium]
MFRVGVFGIITDDKDRVLLCHRRDFDLWNLPGGGVDPGESPCGALVREIEEETGLEAAPVHLSGVYSKPDSNEIVFSFFCRVTGGAIRLTDEADRIEYFSPDRIPRNTVPKQVERIRDFFSDRKGTHYRVQSGAGARELIRQGKL